MAAWTSKRTGRWNDDAANASSPWNGAGNPASGVPANNDTVTIAAGHDVEYDADQSGFANGITLVITGTLHASTTAGSYVLKMAANMTGAGTLRAGTSGTPYPTNCTFEIQRGGFEITATNMTLDLNCSEPTHKYIRLSGVEAAGQTIWSVDTDVTGESAYWADGALVRICDVNFGNDNAEHTIAAGGVAATTLTVTAGLTAQKETGAYVILVSRNVKITHTAATGNGILNATNGRIFAEIRNVASALNVATSCAIGGTLSGGSSGMASSIGNTISAAIVGCTNGLNGGNGNVVLSTGLLAGHSTAGYNTGAGCVISSPIAGCVNGLLNSSTFIVYGTITGCTQGISGGGGHKIINTTLTNTSDLRNLADSLIYNSTLSGTTENNGYNSANVNISAFVESIDHDAVAGAYKAWTRGGIVTKTAAVFPTGYTSSQQHACESASFYCFQNYSLTIPAGGGLVVQCYVQKDASMSYLPRVWILLPGVEPFISGSPSYEAIMTDSLNTWETLALVYANAGTAPVTVTVRTVAKNASGNVYFYPINTVLAPATYDVYNTLLGYVDTIESRLPAALVGGRMDSSVGAMANNVLTAAAIATDAIDADALANDAITEIQTGLATAASIAALNNLSAAQVWDLVNGVEAGLTPRQAMRLMAAALAGVLAGAATNTVTINNAVANSKARIVATVDANGNRTVVNTDTT